MTAVTASSASVSEPGGPLAAGPGRPSWLTPWRMYGLMICLAIGIAAVSLLAPSTPSYDPWSWIIWGREITLHGTLNTTGGTSWKPLPVVFTAILALFGHAQPNLWLVVARAGAAVSTMMIGWLAFRMTAWLAGPDGPAIRRWLPGLVAAAAAMVGLALSSNFLSSSALGYSEGLALAATLIGIDRHLDGHYRQAFALGFVTALDRPEVWLFWGPYGLWLMWKDPGARVLVVGLAIATIALWFVPQKIGGGSFTEGVSRAHHPRANSAAYTKCPFCTEFKHDAWPKVMLRTKIASLLAIVASLTLLIRAWVRVSAETATGGAGATGGIGGRRVAGIALGAIRLPTARDRALALVAASGIVGFGWWVMIALETQAGFSGNTRYIVFGSALIYLSGSIAFGWAVLALADLIARWRTDGRPRVAARTATIVTSAVMALVFMFFPHWVGGSLVSLPKTHRSLVYQATLRKDVSTLIAKGGGVDRLKACGAGRIMVEGFQVPMVAWYFGVRASDIYDEPMGSDGLPLHTAPAPWPNVILQDRDTGGTSAPLLPPWTMINDWIKDGARYTVYTAKEMRMFIDCRPQAGDVPQTWSA